MGELSLLKILVLGVLALIIFGPDRLPQAARQAGRLLRDLRALADRAQNDLRDHLGPEFSDLTIADLHPRTYLRKHLLDDSQPATAARAAPATGSQTPLLQPGERPPCDPEST